MNADNVTPVIKQTVNPEDYTIVREEGLVKCYNTNHTKDKKNLSKYLPVWVARDDEEPVNYNGPVPQKINLNHKVKHYHDFDTTELYVAYDSILKIIKRFEDQAKDPRKYRGEIQSKFTMNELRSYCQVWLDDVRFRQDGQDRWWVWDRVKYFLRGQLKRRKAWLQTFGTICWDMCAKLDAIDGGNNQEQQITPPQQHHIGFN